MSIEVRTVFPGGDYYIHWRRKGWGGWGGGGGGVSDNGWANCSPLPSFRRGFASPVSTPPPSEWGCVFFFCGGVAYPVGEKGKTFHFHHILFVHISFFHFIFDVSRIISMGAFPFRRGHNKV